MMACSLTFVFLLNTHDVHRWVTTHTYPPSPYFSIGITITAIYETFSIMEEDHTLANSARFVLNQDSRVAFCGYSIPHPADNKVNIRVQTTGDPAKDVLKDALQDLMVMCQHVRGTFHNAVTDFRSKKPAEQMDM